MLLTVGSSASALCGTNTIENSIPITKKTESMRHTFHKFLQTKLDFSAQNFLFVKIKIHSPAQRPSMGARRQAEESLFSFRIRQNYGQLILAFAAGFSHCFEFVVG